MDLLYNTAQGNLSQHWTKEFHIVDTSGKSFHSYPTSSIQLCQNSFTKGCSFLKIVQVHLVIYQLNPITKAYH